MTSLHHDIPTAGMPLLAAVERDHRTIELRVFDTAGLHVLGRYENVAEAWRAVDAIDCPELTRH